ncbi:hypothetical protein EDC01DRAFT_645719 [Geopyxis carbonaria]|nr:hypothetical protein EDC01DRAFT_645719 [Geopyxis carbonaria]
MFQSLNPFGQKPESSTIETPPTTASPESIIPSPPPPTTTNMSSTEEQKKPAVEQPEPLKGDESDEQIAKKLSALIDSANERIKPLLEMMKKHLATAEHDKANDKLDEDALVKQVKPLIEEATNILRETQGAIKALDPEGTIANNASRKSADHEASKEEQHLAEALGTLTGDVTKTIEEARDKIKDMPNAKKNLGPLLDMLSDPLFQIVSGVGLLLNGVLSLLGNILDGLGLGGIVRNILSGLGLEKVLKGLGLTGLFKS